jgi:hypothetical protein
MSALLSLNGYAGVNSPFTGSILGFPEPRMGVCCIINGSLPTGGGSFGVVLEGTNDVTGYTGGFPNLLGWNQTAGVYSTGSGQAAMWTPILSPAGNIMTTFDSWDTSDPQFVSLFNSFTGSRLFPGMKRHYAAVRARLATVIVPGSLIIGVSISASATESS